MDQVVPAREILDRVDAAFPLEAEVAPGDTEPATRYRYRDGAGDIGVIPSVTEPFCDNCDRVRVTAEGKFRTCLFALEEFDLRAIVRGEAGEASDDSQIDDRLASEIERAVGTKWAGHRIGQVNFVRPARSMSQIGG
jgi:GTP 3',8-cyclase